MFWIYLAKTGAGLACEMIRQIKSVASNGLPM
jgi:hypothetical protein